MNHTYKAYIKPNDKYCIQHYGIKGQKWGVRNYEGYDGKLTPEGKERYYGKRELHFVNDEKQQRVMNNKIMRDARIMTRPLASLGVLGMAINPILGIASTVALPTIGLATDIAIRKHTEKKAIEADKQYAEARSKKPIDKRNGLHIETEELTDEESIKRVNPLYNNWYDNTKENCVLCSAAMEMRKRGYDVTANKISMGLEWPLSTDTFFKLDKKYNIVREEFDVKNRDKIFEFYDTLYNKAAADRYKASYDKYAAKDKYYWYPPYEVKIPTKESSREIESFKDGVSKEPNSRGNIVVDWNGTYSSGHCMYYEVDKTGNVKVMDGQNGKIYSYEQFYKTYKGKVKNIATIRLDNAKINNAEIKKAVS